jgi:hypothetical protein
MAPSHLTRIYLGGLEIEISFPSELRTFDPAYLPFLSPPSENKKFDKIQLSVVASPIEDKWMQNWKAADLLLDTGETWALELTGDKEWPYHFGPSPTFPSDPPVLHCLASDSFKKAQVFFPQGTDSSSREIHSRSYPLDEVLARHALLQHQSLLLHASGVTIGDRGYLFLGDSGAGKSTIAELLEAELGPGIIHSDDRIVLREREGKWYMYGTPWHGTFPRVLSQGIEVAGFFYLEKSEKNFLVPLEPSQALPYLFPVCLGVWWLKASTDKQVQLLESLALGKGLQHCRFGFRKDSSASKFLLSHLRASANA